MERFEQYKKEEEEENFNSLNNVFLIILILLFAYMVEKRFPNSFIKNIYFILVFFIIVIFILKNVSKNFSDKLQKVYKKMKNRIPIFQNEEKEEEENNKKNIKKIKNIYELGYIQNKRYNANQPIQYNNFNSNNISKFITKNKEFKDDEYLANKISNINKINKSTLRDSFTNKDNQYINNTYETNNNYLNNNYEINNNNNIGNNYYNNNFNNYDNNINRKLTRLPNSDENDEKYNDLQNKSILSNPFNAKIKSSNSKDYSSSNFYLFSNSKSKKQNNLLNIDTFNASNDKNPINRFIGIDNFQSTNSFLEHNNYNIPKNKQVSYMKYQNLKKTIVNTQALNQTDSNKFLNIDNNKIPRELANIKENSLIIRMKMFISKTLIPHILSAHDNNLNSLNNILSHLGLKIISTSPENDSDDYLETLREKLSLLDSNRINEIKQDNNLLFENLKNKYTNTNNIFDLNNFNNFNNEISNKNKKGVFPSLYNLSTFLNTTKEINEIKDDENNLKCIFFGDTIKIKNILYLIENKISNLKEIKEKINMNELKSNIIKKINYTNNPFIKSPSAKVFNDYLKNPNETNLSLTNLLQLLYERIIINERLYPKEFFIHKSDQVLLIMEYAIERFRQLYGNFEHYWNESRGGEFLNEGWCTLLPTDSQLIAHLIINYLESLYEINNNNKNRQIFLISYPMNYNINIEEDSSNSKSQTSIFLYQINPPDTEPKFYIVYKGSLIPCRIDYNLFHSFGIYFYLLSIESHMFVMSLGIHDFIYNIIK